MKDPIKIPFDANGTPREQIGTAIASLPPLVCPRHSGELRLLDKAHTVTYSLRDDYLSKSEFTAVFHRCSQCPQNTAEKDIETSMCAVRLYRYENQQRIRDENGKLLPYKHARLPLEPDLSVRAQFEAWCEANGKAHCSLGNESLRSRERRMVLPFDSFMVHPQFAPCPQCSLESLGITPDEAHASFDNFVVIPPALRQQLEHCRAFAAAPKGVLLLLGHVGTGKTHLSIAVLRERLRQGMRKLAFIKHRHFLAEHWRALRPVAFREDPPESPLIRCQESSLLVYDDLTTATDSRAYEDVLLDLFEARIGQHKPSIITANVSRDGLEAALGTRLFDRLRRAAFAVLEFGFESKRPSLNADYLRR